MARVNVDQKALSDPRFGVLARLMGTGDRDTALGRMVRVWNECAERETQVLSHAVLEDIFGHPDAANWIVTAELGSLNYRGVSKRTKSNYIRIKGTAGRIEWLAKRRQEGRLGGRKGGRPPKTPRGLPPETPPAPAPAPALNS